MNSTMSLDLITGATELTIGMISQISEEPLTRVYTPSTDVFRDSATALASYEHKVWNEYAAVTENSYGNGNSLYLGTLFGEDTLIEILEY